MASAAKMIEIMKQKRQVNEVEINCKRHGTAIVKQVVHGAHVFQMPACPQCAKEQEDQKEQEQLKYQEAQRQQSNLKAINIYPRFEYYSFESYDAQKFKQTSSIATIAKKYCSDFESRLQVGSNLLFHGNIGTGKTFFAISILKQAVISGYSTKYVEMPTLFRFIKSQFKYPDFDEQKYIDDLSKPNFLVIDELGIGYGSDFEKGFIFSLINQRYNMMKPIIAISNLGIEDLKQSIGARVVDRLTDKSITCEFNWQSLRQR